MIYLKLFLYFLEIGTVSFGGGYSMIPLLRDIVLSEKWLSESEFMDFIAVSESTPGPIAVNMATFIGSSQGGIFGAFLATMGVILPAFAVILIICAILKNLLKYKSVSAFLEGVRPCTVGLIVSAAVTLALPSLLGFSENNFTFSPDLIGIGIFFLITIGATLYKKIVKKKISPVVLILISAVMGIILYSTVS